MSRINKKNRAATSGSGSGNEYPDLLTKPLVITIAVICLGCLQFGYHIAELNAPQQVMSCSEFSNKINNEGIPFSDTWLGRHNFTQCIPLDNSQIGTVTSMFTIGGLFGSYFASSISKSYGRKKTAFIANIINAIGSYILFASNSYTSLIIGRLIVGLGSGIFIVNAPLFISEVTPLSLKGLMGSMNQVSINLGIILTQFCALFFANAYQWRWILFVAFIVSICNMVLLVYIRESPKWLVQNHDLTNAELSLFSLRLRSDIVKDELSEIQKDLNNEQLIDGYDTLEANSSNMTNSSPSLWEYVTSSTFKKPRNAITMILMGQQFCGINSIIFYGVKVISNLTPNWALQINFAISILNVIMTVVSSFVIDKKGRKPLLLISTSILSISAFLISVSITQDIVSLLVISLFVYIAAFAFGLGPIPFLIISELSSPNDSVIAQSYGTICNWLATFVVAYCFPVLHDLLGGYVYTIFGVFGTVFTFYILKRVPETRGKSSYTQVWSDY
ncbi:hypothetical protein Kpol_534p27 [Vanderwaltozyma polyspora DSM 70294]|uniref:Major facilitator superfamily (MFS) profile domain-containing protein n=1 Tax=Vanderwaltozyma polyspora (strain ATCC 22028 / DSM 70294 / BCRC 21397 / CBS 2163 / NBRC 10782 / NRRL Y-8283 / UCD 57-17) TaxID=436907 RepID=A7TJK5_VANPO|nr:uncharacterized protein Kpol_534p27 [Vanderwaltozyma polyspora DSM 70294]EDO17548.1 hypothetical protein Kpol_534p27 [Vanderwaltozyma polyspora DSM 70294]